MDHHARWSSKREFCRACKSQKQSHFSSYASVFTSKNWGKNGQDGQNSSKLKNQEIEKKTRKAKGSKMDRIKKLEMEGNFL